MPDHPLHSAYVAAWVWVELPVRDEEYSDEEIRKYAQEHYTKDGEVEIDDDAIVSPGDEACDCEADTMEADHE